MPYANTEQEICSISTLMNNHDKSCPEIRAKVTKSHLGLKYAKHDAFL